MTHDDIVLGCGRADAERTPIHELSEGDQR
jgi:hypothetical protein